MNEEEPSSPAACWSGSGDDDDAPCLCVTRLHKRVRFSYAIVVQDTIVKKKNEEKVFLPSDTRSASEAFGGQRSGSICRMTIHFGQCNDDSSIVPVYRIYFGEIDKGEGRRAGWWKRQQLFKRRGF